MIAVVETFPMQWIVFFLFVNFPISLISIRLRNCYVNGSLARYQKNKVSMLMKTIRIYRIASRRINLQEIGVLNSNDFFFKCALVNISLGNFDILWRWKEVELWKHDEYWACGYWRQQQRDVEIIERDREMGHPVLVIDEKHKFLVSKNSSVQRIFLMRKKE